MAMYTQQQQRIEIIVKKGDSTSPKGTETTDPTTTDNENATETQETQNKFNKRFKKVNLTHAVAIAKQVSGLALNYVVGGIGYATGDQAYQEQVQRTVEIAQDVSGLASSVAIGMTYGSAGGPVGMALGATFALVSNGASLGVKYAGRQREYNLKIFKQENNIAYKQARANISLTTGRLR